MCVHALLKKYIVSCVFVDNYTIERQTIAWKTIYTPNAMSLRRVAERMIRLRFENG